MKDPKRQKAACKDKENYIKKVKESILNKATNDGSRDTSNESNDATNASTSATTSAANAITISSNTYIYGVGIVAVLTILKMS